jgi:hypothetical protein
MRRASKPAIPAPDPSILPVRPIEVFPSTLLSRGLQQRDGNAEIIPGPKSSSGSYAVAARPQHYGREFGSQLNESRRPLCPT